MGKVNNFKTFESENNNVLKTKRFKDLHNWGKTNNYNENELESTNHIIKSMKSKGTPLLDWVNSKGYSIGVVEGASCKGCLDNLGMDGSDYTFYLIPSWSKESYMDFIMEDVYINDEEIIKILDSIGLDIDDLPIYGKNKNCNLFFSYDGVVDSGELSEIIFIKDEPYFDPIKITYEVEEYEMNYSDCPLWGAKIMMRFNSMPQEGSEDHNVLCEYGLMMIKSQIGKLMLLTGTKDYVNLEKNMSDMPDIILWETEFLIEYMNKSNIHITKNEDLLWAKETSYNLYKAYKLFHENHIERKYKIDKSFVHQFMKGNN